MTSPSPAPDFAKGDGLLPAIAQDAATGEVLMLAYMNHESYDETLTTGRAVYFSRSRNKLWRKGEESGNVQQVREIFVDCDADTILLKVHQIGGAACHEGYASCFFRQVTPGGLQGRSASGCSIRRKFTRRNSLSRARCRSNARRLHHATHPFAQTRHSRRQPARGHRRAVPPRRLQDHVQLAQLLSHDRRRRDRVHADPRAGDGPLCRGRRARRGTHRPRLDHGERRRRARGRRAGVLQGQPPAGALGAVRARELAVPDRQGSARQADRHRGGRPDPALPGPARRDRPRSSSVGAPPKSSRPGWPTRSSKSPRPAARCGPINLRIVDEVLHQHDALHRQSGSRMPSPGRSRRSTTSC